MAPQRIFQETFYNLKRSPGATSLTIGTIAASLFMLGGYSLLVQNLYRMVGGVRTQAVVMAYLSDDADTDLLQAAASKLPGAASVKLVTKDEALKRLQASVANVEGLLEAVQGNPLPASLEVTPTATTHQTLESLSSALAALPGVEEVDYGRSWLDKLEALINFMVFAGIVIGAAVALVSSFLVAGTLRSSIFSRRDEIEVLKLVGATDGYVRAPFLVEGAIEGSLGAGVALFALFLVHRTAGPEAQRLLSLAFGRIEVSFLDPGFIAGLAAAGTIMGLSGSYLAINSVLKRFT